MKRERCCLRKLDFTHEGPLRHRVFFRDRFWDAALLSGAVRVIGLAFPSRYGETRSHSAFRTVVGGGVCG